MISNVMLKVNYLVLLLSTYAMPSCALCEIMDIGLRRYGAVWNQIFTSLMFLKKK